MRRITYDRLRARRAVGKGRQSETLDVGDLAEFGQDAPDIFLGLWHGGQAAFLIDAAGAGVVGARAPWSGCPCTFRVVVCRNRAPPWTLCFGIEGIGNLEFGGGGGHELHEALGAFWRYGAGRRRSPVQ